MYFHIDMIGSCNLSLYNKSQYNLMFNSIDTLIRECNLV